MRRIVLLPFTAFACSSLSAMAAESGVFCGDVTFIERVEPNGTMMFSVIGANRQKNIISLSGSAVPRRNGWRYQVKSDSAPNDRCTLDIEERSGGFHLHTVDGARCVNQGGENAYIALIQVDLPASTRVKGAIPTSDQYGLVDFDCAGKKFANAAAPAGATSISTSTGNPTEAGQSILQTLAEVVAMYGKGRMGPFASAQVMRKHFTKDFISIWERGSASDPPVIDADPLTSGQMGVNALTLDGAKVVSQAANSAIVNMRLTQTNPDNGRSSGNIKVYMRREDGNWKIDDIEESEAGTWRRYIEQSLSKPQ